MDFKTIWTLIKETFQDWSEDKAPRLAAALSYYTVFSLAPLLILVIMIAGFIIGSNDNIRQQILTQVESMMGAQGAEAVNTLITNTTAPGGGGIIATIISLVTLLLGATGVFGQLQDALNTIWEVKPKEGRGIMGMLKDRFLSFTMILGVAFLLLVSLVVSAALSVVNNYFTELLGGIGILAQILNIIVSLGVITLIFAMIFKILPDVDIAWGDVWIGALVTAILFTLGKQALSIYLSRSAPASAFGAAGSLVILLLWVYYSAQILFLGAEFTQVYARHKGSKIVPSRNARPLTEIERTRQGTTRKRVPLENVQKSMMPVTGQPEIYAPPEQSSVASPQAAPRERIRYTPPNPATVVPVIAGGTLAGVLTIGKIVRKVVSSVRGDNYQTHRRYRYRR